MVSATAPGIVGEDSAPIYSERLVHTERSDIKRIIGVLVPVLFVALCCASLLLTSLGVPFIEPFDNILISTLGFVVGLFLLFVTLTEMRAAPDDSDVDVAVTDSQIVLFNAVRRQGVAIASAAVTECQIDRLSFASGWSAIKLKIGERATFSVLTGNPDELHTGITTAASRQNRPAGPMGPDRTDIRFDEALNDHLPSTRHVQVLVPLIVIANLLVTSVILGVSPLEFYTLNPVLLAANGALAVACIAVIVVAAHTHSLGLRVLVTPEAVIVDMANGNYVTWTEIDGIRSWSVSSWRPGPERLTLNLATTPVIRIPIRDATALGELIDELKTGGLAHP